MDRFEIDGSPVWRLTEFRPPSEIKIQDGELWTLTATGLGGGAYWRLKSDWGGVCAMCVWVSVCTVLVWMDGWMDGHKPREAAASSVSMSDRREIRGGGGPGGAGNGRPGDSLWRLLRRCSSSTLGRYELVLSWLPFRAGRTPCF